MTPQEITQSNQAIKEVEKTLAEFLKYQDHQEDNTEKFKSLGVFLIEQGKKICELQGLQVDAVKKPVSLGLQITEKESPVLFIIQQKIKRINADQVNNTQIINGIKNAMSSFEGAPMNDLQYIEDMMYELTARSFFGCMYFNTKDSEA